MKNTSFIKLLRIVFIISFFVALLLAAATIWQLLGEIDNIAKIAVSETESLKAQTVALRERASILMTLFLFILFFALGLLVVIAGYIRERFDKIEAALNGRNETLEVRTEELEELNRKLDASYEEIAQANETLQMQAYQLKISEERYRQMFENMRSGVAIYEAVDDGMDFVFKSFNSAAEKIESLKREQVLQKHLSDIFPGVGDFGFLQALKEVNESGKAQNFPIGFYEDNRISGWRENFIYKLTTGEIVVIYDDITERKKAEEELKESKYFLQTIIEMEPECVKIIDDKGRLTFMNSAGLEMIEADSLEQVAGRPALGIIAPEHQYSYAKLHKRVLEGERMRMQYEVIGLKGGRRWLETHAVPMQDHGKTVHLAVTRDIAERKEAEERLKAFSIELEQKVAAGVEELRKKELVMTQQSKMAAMGEMIGAIAHQWRQPLNSLSVMIQDIPMAYKFGELNEEYIANFKQKSIDVILSMSNTIDDFRNFFSPNKKQEEFFVEDAIDDVLKIMSAQLTTNNINVVFDGKSGKHRHICHKNELKQALLNILANAKDALLEIKKADSFIKIDVVKIGGKLLITIEDSAGGIPVEIMDNIFEPYFTTKSADKGTGLGLYISKEIIEHNLNGRLTVKNTQNGARFDIELLDASQGA